MSKKKKPVKKRTPLQVTLNPRFALGDEVWEVFWNDDIGAWDFESWRVEAINVKINEHGAEFVYIPVAGMSDIQIDETDELFHKAWDAAQTARKRNRELRQE